VSAAFAFGKAIQLDPHCGPALIKKGSNLDFGARPLRRAIENYVEDALSEELLRGTFQGKNKIVVDVVRTDEGKVKHLKFEGALVKKGQAEPVGVGTIQSDSPTSEPPERKP